MVEQTPQVSGSSVNVACAPSASSEALGELASFYRSSPIRARMAEFIGGSDPRISSAAYVTASDGTLDSAEPASVERFPRYLASSSEIDRSLWDRNSLIADIDLEYHNFDNPAAAWEDPERAFRLQQPVLDAILRILGDVSIDPLVLVSGRGFHLVWAIPRDSRAFRRMVCFGRVPKGLESRYACARSPSGLRFDPRFGRAFAGFGQLMEFLFQRVFEASRRVCAVPLQPAAIEVGPGAHGREIVSFDLSEYGDPLHTRHIRIPFSLYLKPRRFEWKLGAPGVDRLMPIFEIPLDGMTPQQAFKSARDPKEVLALARRTCMRIPDTRASMENLLDEYEGSDLAAFHRRFHQELPDQLDLPQPLVLPDVPCLKWTFEHANDWLLRPGALQHVTRVLSALGWSAPSIAQMVSACYRSDCDWGETWARLEPTSRALFYVRLFAGMIATGTDELIDMNCVSHQEKGYCAVPDCRSNLADLKNILLRRRPN